MKLRCLWPVVQPRLVRFLDSLATENRPVPKKEPDRTIRSPRLRKRCIGIKFFITYPCRAARWIGPHRKVCSVELKAVNSMLCIQPRQAVLREFEDGGASLDVGILPDTADALTLPFDEAKGAISCWDTVSVDDHKFVVDEAPSSCIVSGFKSGVC